MCAKSDKTAVVLLSGGLDSATTLAIARDQGFACHALSFDYGQRHRFELSAAQKVVEALGAVDHRVMSIDLSAAGGFGKSALTDDLAVPKDRIPVRPGGREIGKAEDRGAFINEKSAIRNPQSAIPVTYVPARNTIFLSVALGYAEVLGAFDVFVGVNAVDYSGYPDCRCAFIEAFEKLANVATAAAVEGRGRFRIHAPLIEMTKAQIIRTGLGLGVDFSLTVSCYDPDPEGRACGRCDSCGLRRKGFEDAGVPDPTVYRDSAKNGGRR